MGEAVAPGRRGLVDQPAADGHLETVRRAPRRSSRRRAPRRRARSPRRTRPRPEAARPARLRQPVEPAVDHRAHAQGHVGAGRGHERRVRAVRGASRRGGVRAPRRRADCRRCAGARPRRARATATRRARRRQGSRSPPRRGRRASRARVAARGAGRRAARPARDRPRRPRRAASRATSNGAAATVRMTCASMPSVARSAQCRSSTISSTGPRRAAGPIVAATASNRRCASVLGARPPTAPHPGRSSGSRRASSPITHGGKRARARRPRRAAAPR